MSLKPERQGEIYIVSSALIWGFFPILTILSYQKITPLLSLAISTLVSSFLFGFIFWRKKNYWQLKDGRAMKDTLIMTLIIGVAYYVLFFWGLKFTSAGNASLIALIETLFSYLFFNVWREEHISYSHIAGALFMLVGAGIVLWPNFHSFKLGDILVLSASAIAPLGNFYQRRARLRVGSDVIWLVRSLIASPILFVIAYLFGERINFVNLSSIWWLLILNGIFVMGLSKIFWLESIHRINVAKANALSSVSVIVTFIFSWRLLGQSVTHNQLLAIVPVVIGLWLLSGYGRVKFQPSTPVSD